MLRIIDTTNNERTMAIMKEFNFSFELKDDKIRASIEQSSWNNVQDGMKQEGISIIELTKTTSLDGRLN
jgi:hypothetical protein